MKREEKMGVPRLIRRRAHGQSIPLIALMIVVIVAMVGLSVDVGNTFARERQIVAAANAASVAGMNAYLDTSAPSTATIYDAINDTLRANGVNPDDPALTITRTFLDYKAEPIAGASEIKDDPQQAPNNVAYVTVDVRGTVDTYFARVVNRDTLPVNTQTYAGACPAGSGIYPIAIWSGYIQGNNFIDPGATAPGDNDPDFRVISGGEYNGRTARRIYLKENSGLSGGFSWLQWDPSPNGGNAPSLAASLTGFGNLAGGFQEDEWPANWPNKPEIYPEKPGEINAGDWVAGNTGVSLAGDVRNALEGHIQNGTRMILPIFGDNTGNGQSGSYHIVRLGLFVMLEFEQTGKKYFDLVFLGDAVRQRTACVVGLPPPSDTTTLEGTVQFMPAYPSVTTDYRPVQYVVVLDVSGSMNATFDGIGTHPTTGQNVQCTNGPNGEPHQNCGKSEYAYHDETQRRIYVAKEGLKLFADLVNIPGSDAYDDQLPKDRVAMVWWNNKAPKNWKLDFTDNQQTLLTAISNAGKVQNDEYKTDGGTNGAAGLYRAAQLFQGAPKITNELGQQWEYRRIVLFITDGVSNYFLNDSNPNGDLDGGQSSPSTFPVGSYCRSLGQGVVENADCQTNGVGGIHNGKNRPVSEMIRIAQEQIKNNPAVGLDSEIYVLALSNIPSTGLESGVASPGGFFAARNLDRDANDRTAVDRAMIEIIDPPGTTPCVEVEEAWKDKMFGNEYTSYGEFSYPSRIGKVILRNSVSGVQQESYISVDSSGQMNFEFDDLPNGTYQMQAFIYYKHPLDPNSLPRQYSRIYQNGEELGETTVVVDGDDLTIQLKGDGNVCLAAE